MEVILGLLVVYLVYQEIKLRRLQKANQEVPVNAALYDKALKDLQKSLLDAQNELGDEREKGRTLLSQKKSSETRLGQISENLVPFLTGCRHDPKNMMFLGNPLDYLVFNLDEGEIIFLEVKSGNSKPSKRQKTIKNLIQSGRVYYEELRVNEKGVKTKSFKNVESPVTKDEESDEE